MLKKLYYICRSTNEKINIMKIGLATALFITFLVLKLTENIDWSWWWVTSPLWIPLALGLTMFLIAIIFATFND